ncbi:hypothetical protein F7O85_11305 [Vibrio panuliri]|nr:hypothetical protein F7O85_11305 [Vibrio panuliri]
MKLESCPFCGSYHLSVEMKASAWNDKHQELHIVCNDCACMTPVYIWNRRQPSKLEELSQLSSTRAI